MNGNDQSMESNGTRVRHADPTHSQIPDEVSQVRKPPVLFLVIPCYREQEQLPITTPILERKMGSMIDAKMISQSSRILFVDDGSQDHTWRSSKVSTVIIPCFSMASGLPITVVTRTHFWRAS